MARHVMHARGRIWPWMGATGGTRAPRARCYNSGTAQPVRGRGAGAQGAIAPHSGTQDGEWCTIDWCRLRTAKRTASDYHIILANEERGLPPRPTSCEGSMTKVARERIMQHHIRRTGNAHCESGIAGHASGQSPNA